VEALFLTHFHSDHTSGIPDVWLTGWTVRAGRRTSALQVVGPSGTKAMMGDLRKAYGRDIETRVADENLPREGVRVAVTEFAHDGVVYDKDGVKVTAFAVDHGPKIKPAYGYRVDYQGRSVVISGDTRYSPNLIRHAMGVDLLIHEVMVDPVGPLSPELKSVQDHHASPSDAGRVFTATAPKLAVYSHIVVAPNPDVTPGQLERSTRATYAGPLEVGADLTSFDIADTVVVHRWKP
jgi:ribonuclease Z